MANGNTYDELDLRLIHAIQIAPRAPWRRLAGLLEVSTATLTRRWKQINENGDAWVTGYPNPRRFGGAAVLEINCGSRAVDEVARTLTQSPLTVSAREMSGSTELLASVRARSIPDLSAYIREARMIDGVRTMRVNIVTRLFTTGARWRLDALSPAQVRAIHPLALPQPRPLLARLDDIDQRLVRELGYDGRATAVQLAQNLGVSVNTVRRRLHTLFENGSVEVRCDVSSSISGRDAIAAFWLEVSPEHLVETAQTLGRMPAIRAIFSLAGPRNLHLIAWLRHPSELPEFEAEVVRLVPGVVVADRAVQLRALKIAGHLLDEGGRVAGFIPFAY